MKVVEFIIINLVRVITVFALVLAVILMIPFLIVDWIAKAIIKLT